MNIQKKKLYKNAFLILVALILFSLVFEIILRIIYPLYSNFNTEMWRYSREIKTLSKIPNVSHIHMPNKQSILYKVAISTNSLGFRDYEYNLSKANGVGRILVLGDSVTLGWGVNLSDTYPKVLEKMLNKKSQKKYEVINTAVGNYNTEMEANILEYYQFLKPDAVIVGFFPNDGEKTVMMQDGIIYRLKKSFYLYPFFWDKYVKIKYLIARGKGDYTSTIHSFYTEEYGGKENLDRSFAKLRYLSEGNVFKVYIVIIPQFYNEFKDYDGAEIHSFVKELCKKYNFVCIDLLDEFKQYSLTDIIISNEDAHPNPSGHKIIANKIYEVLNERET